MNEEINYEQAIRLACELKQIPISKLHRKGLFHIAKFRCNPYAPLNYMEMYWIKSILGEETFDPVVVKHRLDRKSILNNLAGGVLKKLWEKDESDGVKEKTGIPVRRQKLLIENRKKLSLYEIKQIEKAYNITLKELVNSNKEKKVNTYKKEILSFKNVNGNFILRKQIKKIRGERKPETGNGVISYWEGVPSRVYR
ncbi:hypothetical protein [Aerococcus kribbianus]|uniref:Uncharacterized protein n=1 Tax=Aerococcus kribbianus TaxID=2999064 RepID=A0A9X3JH06_9LACT|nr:MULTISPECIES: hypothetical protein [unclassified Aerococcus]MCZ0717847.1 hypothetical protein [Aerococcus sp. YH-aer221]MCZ0726134.1 hypothetical protein [Aerococcus sp. YH-aer222]